MSESIHAPGPLWRLPAVAAQTGLSKSEIYRRIKAGSFPKPLKLGARAVAWPAAEIEAWVRALIQGAAN
ncbi:MAG TPA: AlpA family transcriptional regulator [Noviherbaspirillum sp.]|nr:AlpA family transcriptional regulator [Noviherbaspirillum sp.]